MFIGPLRGLGAKFRAIKAILDSKLTVPTSTLATTVDLAAVMAQVTAVLARTDVAVSTRAGGIRQVISGSVNWTSGGWNNFDLSGYGILNYNKCLLMFTGCVTPGGTFVTAPTGAVFLNRGAHRVDGAGGGGSGVYMMFDVVEYN